jgi:hypothetical protein
METPLHGGFRLMPESPCLTVVGLALLDLRRFGPLLSKFENFGRRMRRKALESLQLELKALRKVDTRNTNRHLLFRMRIQSILSVLCRSS